MGAPARCLVVMGVCGSGKSAVAAALADRLGLQALDADDLHAPEAVARMRAGIALRDEDRWPWLDRVGQRLRQAAAPPGPGIAVACSALRPSQLRTLERPGPDEPDVHRVDIAPPLAAVVAQALAALAAGSLPGAVGPAAAPSHPLRPDPTGACR